MAGIYIHIPFCKRKCSYCDFYSETNLEIKKHLIKSICEEIRIRKNDLKENEKIKTIYFGGGTPSLLDKSELKIILENIHTHFDTSLCEEITIETNPDDLSEKFVLHLQQLGFNRVSIGIQSFNDKELKLINRRHNAKKAIKAVEICKENGFKNITIDLIYGLPNQTLEIWENNINTALSLDIQHISAYHLTYEKGTPIFLQAKEKKIKPVDENISLNMFKLLIQKLAKNGFSQYEISNFSKKGYQSKHNSSYWTDEPYLGFGPSAHSYNVNYREWNVSNTIEYISKIKNKQCFSEKETLSINEQYNDFIITRLRTKKGIDITEISNKFGEKYITYCLENAERHIKNKNLIFNNKTLRLSRKGIFISDSIFEDLIWV